jgi:hypothetical protein
VFTLVTQGPARGDDGTLGTFPLPRDRAIRVSPGRTPLQLRRTALLTRCPHLGPLRTEGFLAGNVVDLFPKYHRPLLTTMRVPRSGSWWSSSKIARARGFARAPRSVSTACRGLRSWSIGWLGRNRRVSSPDAGQTYAMALSDEDRPTAPERDQKGVV